MKRFKIFLPFICLIVALGILLFIKRGGAPEVKIERINGKIEVADWARYETKDISFRYPSEWQSLPLNRTIHLLLTPDTKKIPYSMTVGLVNEIQGAEALADAFRTNGEYTIESRSFTEIDGHKAVAQEMTTKDGDYQYVVYIEEIKESLLGYPKPKIGTVDVLFAVNEGQNISELKPLFDRVLSTFRFR